MDKIVYVKIYDMYREEPYLAYSLDDCKGETDKEVFKIVQRFRDTIHIGYVSGVPYFESELKK